MSYLFDLPQNLATQLILIAIVTALATLTVATGLDNGIRRLSELIIIVSFVLMLLIVILGPTRFLLSALVENIGLRSEEHTSELQSLMRISYAVFCLKKKNNTK